MSDYEVWTYKVEIYNQLDGIFWEFEYDYDLGEGGSEENTPEDLVDEVRQGIEDYLNINVEYMRSSHE